MIRKNVATASLPSQSNRDWSADTSPTVLPAWCLPKKYILTKAFIGQKFLLMMQLFATPSRFSPILLPWQPTFQKSSRDINKRKLPVLPFPYWGADWLQRPHLASPFLWVLGIWWHTESSIWKLFYSLFIAVITTWKYILFYLCIVNL